MHPAARRAVPRLSEHVMAQIEAPANLERRKHPLYRLITLILIGTAVSGMRCDDNWNWDCLTQDPQGAPYLRYPTTR